MRKLKTIAALLLAAVAMNSCAEMQSLSYGIDDLYQTNNRENIVTVVDSYTRAMAARKASAEKTTAETSAQSVDYNSVLVSDYQTAYERRLYGFESTTYRMPSSYYSMATDEAMRYASAYDPAFYNVMVSGDQVWVEPKYITSMFGTWGATNVTYGLYDSPWMYGWTSYVDPFYYSWWGYPRYSWYDWHCTIGFGPFYIGWGYPGYYPGYYPGFYPYYPGYYPGYHPGYYPPHPGPGYGPHHPHHSPGGRANHNFNGPGSHNTSANRNGGGGYNVRPTSGSTSSGVYNGKSSATRNNNATRTQRDNSTKNESQRSSNFRQSNRSDSRSTSFRGGEARSGGFGGGGGGGGGGRVGGSTSTRR